MGGAGGWVLARKGLSASSEHQSARPVALKLLSRFRRAAPKPHACWERSVGFRGLGSAGFGAAEGGLGTLADVQGAHDGEAGVLAVVAAVVIGAGAGVAGGRRGRAHQRVGEYQREAGQGLTFPRCASEGAKRLGLAREGAPGTDPLVFLGNQDEVV